MTQEIDPASLTFALRHAPEIRARQHAARMHQLRRVAQAAAFLVGIATGLYFGWWR